MHVAFILVSFRPGKLKCDTTKAWPENTIKVILAGAPKTDRCSAILEQRISAVAKIYFIIRRRSGALLGILRASLSKSPFPPRFTKQFATILLDSLVSAIVCTNQSDCCAMVSRAT